MPAEVYEDYIALRCPMLIYEIHSKPTPEKQTRFCMGRAYNPNKRTTQEIIWQLSPMAPKEPLKGAIGMDLFFYLPIPKGTSKALRKDMINGKVRPTTRPDFDNLAYLVTNAMKNLIYHDDAQVVRCLTEKYYSEMPKTVIRVWEM